MHGGKPSRCTRRQEFLHDLLRRAGGAASVDAEPGAGGADRPQRSQRPAFSTSSIARAKIKVMVKRILNKYGYPPDLQEEAVKTVLAQAELLCAGWV